jgi:N-carbamoylputrescine amidase
MRDHVRVAAVSFDARPGETAANLDRLEQWAQRAREAGADLLLAPELSLTGFIPNHPTSDHATWLAEALLGARRMAEPLDGPAVTRLQAVARETGLLLAAGLLEDAGPRLFNTHVLVGPEGLLGAWRKLHVPVFEMPFYDGGSVPPVVDTPLGRIGITICIDAFLPESTRLLAVQGAEIVLFPFAADPPPVSPAGWAAWAQPVVEARCRENGVFGIACNVQGTTGFAGVSQAFGGGALVVGPAGDVIATQDTAGDRPGLLLADLSREAQLRARAAFEYTYRFRRPDLYHLLTRA